MSFIYFPEEKLNYQVCVPALYSSSKLVFLFRFFDSCVCVEHDFIRCLAGCPSIHIQLRHSLLFLDFSLKLISTNQIKPDDDFWGKVHHSYLY